MQRTAPLLGLTLIVVLAGWAVQTLQPTATEVAARHYGLILVDGTAPDLKVKRQPRGHDKDEAAKVLHTSVGASSAPGECSRHWRCSANELAAE
jgi:hypothetical protein